MPTGQLDSFLVSPNAVTDPDDDIDDDNDVSGTVDIAEGPAGYVTGLLTVGEGADASDEPTNERLRFGSFTDDDPGTTGA